MMKRGACHEGMFFRQAGSRESVGGKTLGLADRDDVIVLALPRGGVPVGFEVAKRLHAPLDLMLVRKLGLPGQENWRWARSRCRMFACSITT